MVHARGIRYDAIEPGGKGLCYIEARQRVIGGQIRLLHHVFCERLASGQKKGEPEGPMLIAGDEDAQGVNITLLAAPDCHTVLGFQHNDAPSFLMADSTPLEVLCRNEQKKKASSRPIC